MRLYLDGSPNLVYVKDNWGKMVLVNKTLADFLGRTPDEIITAQPHFPAPTQDGKPGFTEVELEALRIKEPVSIETSMVSASGEKRWFEIRLTPIFWPKEQPLLYGICMDVTDRVQKEAALLRKTAEMEALLAAIPDAYIRMDARGTYLECHIPEGKKMYARPEDKIGKTVFEVLPDGVSHLVADALCKAVATQKMQTLHYQLTYPGDTKPSHFETRVVPFLQDEVVLVIRDVTDQQNAALALREREALYRAVVEDQTEHIMRGDANGRIVYVNDAFCKYVRVPKDEILGRDLFEWMATIARTEVVRNKIQRLSPDSPMVYLEDQLFLDKGDTRWQQWFIRAVYDPATGKLLRYQGVGRDITGLKNTERALRRSREQFLFVTEQLREIFLQVDDRGRWSFLNPAWETITGFKVGGTLGELASDYIHPHDWPYLQAELEKMVLQKRRSMQMDFRLKHANGSWRWVEAHLCQGLGMDGAPSGFAGTLIDITDYRNTLDHLKEAKEAAEEATRARQEFLATISHEIRTPMNGVLGMTNLLMMQKLTDEQAEMVEAVRRSAENLLALMNDILDFSKYEAGKSELERFPFDLTEAVNDTISLFRPRALEKSLYIRSRFNPEPKQLYFNDGNRLRRMLLNLVSNAIKFTHQGGIEVNVSIQPSTQPHTDQVILTVRDSGIGIPRDAQHKLFQPFSQVDSSTTRKYGGTGLGLTIVKKIVELMQGEITLESEPGVGTVFRIRLLLERYQSDVRTKPLQAELEGGLAEKFPMKILVGEDNPISRKLVDKVLQRLGYQADLAVNGLEVLEKIEAQTYDLLLLDVQMPELDGLETARRVKQREDAPYIVAMTAGVGADDREAALAAGMDAYLTKPIRLEQIPEVVRQAANARRR
jgi:PAS domain S-box-containing protein